MGGQQRPGNPGTRGHDRNRRGRSAAGAEVAWEVGRLRGVDARPAGHDRVLERAARTRLRPDITPVVQAGRQCRQPGRDGTLPRRNDRQAGCRVRGARGARRHGEGRAGRQLVHGERETDRHLGTPDTRELCISGGQERTRDCVGQDRPDYEAGNRAFAGTRRRPPRRAANRVRLVAVGIDGATKLLRPSRSPVPTGPSCSRSTRPT